MLKLAANLHELMIKVYNTIMLQLLMNNVYQIFM